MTRVAGIRFALAVAGVTVSCLEPSPAAGTGPPAALEKTQWRPISLAGRNLEDPGRAFLRFEAGGSLHANDGCNAVGGTWKAEANGLSIRLGPSTLMACPPPIDEHAQAFREALGATQRFAREGNRLSLVGRDGATLAVFTPTEPERLAATAWRVHSLINDRHSISGVPEAPTLRIEFGADGSVSGDAGCNTFRGSYTVSGDALSLSPLRTTRKACPEPVMALEAQLLAALGRVATFRLGHHELDLFDPDGARVASLSFEAPAAPGAWSRPSRLRLIASI